MSKKDEVIIASATSTEVEYVDRAGKKKRTEIKGKEKPGTYGPDYERRKAEVNREANSRVITPISHEIFKKTEEEREELKLMKSVHKANMRQQGLDPKKVMNPVGIVFND